MAFNAHGLRRFGYGGLISTTRYSIWHYATNDTAAQVETDGYFDSVASQFKTGDIIIAVVDVDGTLSTRIYGVTATASDVALTRRTDIVVGDQTAVAALTEDSGAIGGTNDGDLPDLTQASATVDLSNMDDGSANNVLIALTGSYDATEAGKIEQNFDKIGDEVNALQAEMANVIAANRENAAAINTVIARLVAAGLLAAA